MTAQIVLTLPKRVVRKLIGQDPMGDLDKPVEIVIGGVRFIGEVEGYSADVTHSYEDGLATLRISAEVEL